MNAVITTTSALMRGLYWVLPSSMQPMFSIASRHLLLLLRHRRGSWTNHQSQSALDTILCASYRPPPSIIYEKQGAPTGWVTFPAEGPSRARPAGGNPRMYPLSSFDIPLSLFNIS